VADDASLFDVFRGTVPFMLLMLATLILVIMFPGLSVWLPSLVH
jgi:TRAP-type mannitol/chloroaromatic compound transport system permease large subunit